MADWLENDRTLMVQLRATGSTWERVAESLGRRHTSEACRMEYRRMLAGTSAAGKVLPIPVSPMPNRRNTNVLHTDDFLVLADIHAPHQDAEFIGKLIKLASTWGVTHCIVNGDLFDHAGFKTHPSRSGEAHFKQELDAVRGIIAGLAEAFEEVVITIGNHEERLLNKMLGAQLDVSDWQWLFSRHENVTTHDYSFVFAYGTEKYVIGHPDKYAKDPAKVPSNIQLEHYPDHHVIGAHTHHVGLRVRRNSLGEFFAIDPGTCSLPETMAYTQQPFGSLPRMCQGAVIVKDAYPHLLVPGSPWDAYELMYGTPENILPLRRAA